MQLSGLDRQTDTPAPVLTEIEPLTCAYGRHLPCRRSGAVRRQMALGVLARDPESLSLAPGRGEPRQPSQAVQSSVVGAGPPASRAESSRVVTKFPERPSRGGRGRGLRGAESPRPAPASERVQQVDGGGKATCSAAESALSGRRAVCTAAHGAAQLAQPHKRDRAAASRGARTATCCKLAEQGPCDCSAVPPPARRGCSG